MRGKVLRRLNPVELMARVRETIEAETGVPCVANPEGVESPLYCVEYAGSAPAKSKTMLLEDHSLYIHAIAEPSDSQAGVLTLMTRALEALSQVPELAPPFHTVSQTDQGIIQVKQDPTREWHAIDSYTVRVSYGLLIK